MKVQQSQDKGYKALPKGHCQQIWPGDVGEAMTQEVRTGMEGGELAKTFEEVSL